MQNMNSNIQIRLLENVMKVAARAYWRQFKEEGCGEESGCGDYPMTSNCQDCPHHEVCKAEFEFNRLITAEKNAGKM